MRTSADLRTAIEQLASEAPDPAGILLRPSPPRAGAPHLRSAHRLLPVAAAAVVLAVVGAVLLVVPDRPSVSRTVASPARCAVPPQWTVSADRPPGFTLFGADPHAGQPFKGQAGHPIWLATQYQCGVGYGFLADIILQGKYREQDDAQARSLGYPIGKWPYVPFIGSITSQAPHLTLEIYESVFQFRSERAAQSMLDSYRNTSALIAPGVPKGFRISTSLIGPDDGLHERGIGVLGRVGSIFMAVSFQGGRDLSWDDVRSLWTQVWRQLPETVRNTAQF